MQAQGASDMAEEAAQRSRDVLEYLLDPAAVPGMVRMRSVLESSRTLKSSMLLQKGLAWEATQCVAASRGCGREYPVVVATSGDHVRQYQLVHLEQQVYPWKLFGILRQADTAVEVLEDMATCSKILDPVARFHCQKFPTVDQLLGDQSLAELEAMAQWSTGTHRSLRRATLVASGALGEESRHTP